MDQGCQYHRPKPCCFVFLNGTHHYMANAKHALISRMGVRECGSLRRRGPHVAHMLLLPCAAWHTARARGGGDRTHVFMRGNRTHALTDRGVRLLTGCHIGKRTGIMQGNSLFFTWAESFSVPKVTVLPSSARLAATAVGQPVPVPMMRAIPHTTCILVSTNLTHLIGETVPGSQPSPLRPGWQPPHAARLSPPPTSEPPHTPMAS
jgi:hypothetical protein